MYINLCVEKHILNCTFISILPVLGPLYLSLCTQNTWLCKAGFMPFPGRVQEHRHPASEFPWLDPFVRFHVFLAGRPAPASSQGKARRSCQGDPLAGINPKSFRSSGNQALWSKMQNWVSQGCLSLWEGQRRIGGCIWSVHRGVKEFSVSFRDHPAQQQMISKAPCFRKKEIKEWFCVSPTWAVPGVNSELRIQGFYSSSFPEVQGWNSQLPVWGCGWRKTGADAPESACLGHADGLSRVERVINADLASAFNPDGHCS